MIRKCSAIIYGVIIAAFFIGGDVMSAENKEFTLFDFTKTEKQKEWRPINDTVMGGVSDSRFVVGKGGIARFSGVVSLENNGGFASVRSSVVLYDLSSYEGIRMRIRGDGKRYKLCIKTDPQFDGVLYQSSFETRKEEWIMVTIPFSSFIPTFRGRILKDVPPVATDQIRTFGFLISEKQAGPFLLEIDWIHAYPKKV